MSDEFAAQASRVALRDLEENLVQAERNYEDALRGNDAEWAGSALRQYNETKLQYDSLSGANQPRQPGLSTAQMNFLSRRQSLGDEITPSRMKDYALAHTRAVNAGLEPDTPAYFKAVERSVDSMGDGRQELLNERSAAQICGVSDEVYAANAAKLRNMRLRGEYGD